MSRKKFNLPLFSIALTSPLSSILWVIIGCCLLNLSVNATEGSSSKRKLIDAPPVLTFTPSNFNGFGVSCNGGTNGSVDLTVTGGLSPYTFQWSNGALTEDISSLAAGMYTVTVKDANNETSIDSIEITEPTPVVITLNGTTDVLCSGGSDGSVDITVSGGVPTYTFLWSNGIITEDVNNLQAGTAIVTATDLNGCTKQLNVDILEPEELINSFTVVPFTCGNSNGSITANPDQGTPTYTYLWSTGATTQSISSLGMTGNYTVTITDFNGCSITDVATLTGTTLPLITIDSTQNVSCNNGTNGGVFISVTGASPFGYIWSNSSTNEDLTNVASGNYTVTVTDANLCTATTTASITEPTPILIQGLITNVSCNGGTNGGVDISVSGGTLPYGFLWSNGATTEDISGVVAGTYTITVTDGALCTASQSFIVTQPTVITVSVTPVSTACGLNNGSATANASGGTGTFTYLWSTTATTQTISNLTAGTYTVTVTDQNLCTKSANGTVNSTGAPIITLVSITNVSCNGGSNGGINISVSSGTLPYGFLWSNGATTEDISGVAAGTYTVTVTDGALCTATQSFNITQPTAINLTINPTNPSCGNNNGSATANPTGGTGTFTYLWSTTATTQTINGLAAGTYTVTVTDQNSCTNSASVTLTNSSGPNITLVNTTNVSCNSGNNGAVNISVSGGLPLYNYLWSNGALTQDISNVASGTYTVTVTDALLCTATQSFTVTQPTAINASVSPVATSCGLSNGSATANATGGTGTFTYLWSNAATTQNINGLAAGTYTVTVTDQNLCTRTANGVVAGSSNPVVTFDSLYTPSCNGDSTGAIFITVTGTAAPFTYQWSNSATSQDVINIPSGAYTVTVTDTANCVVTFDTTITQPTAVSDSINFNNATCGDSTGSATVFAYGGTSGYTYLWSNGAITQTITGLAAPQTYTVTIIDFNGCTRVDSVSILNSAAITIITDSIVAPKCFGQTNGAVYISIQGGTPPPAYQWSNSTSQQDLVNVAPGTYTVTATDAVGCTSSQLFTIPNAPSQLNDTISIVNSLCGANNGQLIAFPFGGSSPYSYVWSNGGLTQTISTLLPGTYTVTITDKNGCIKIDSATVASSGNLTLTTDSVVSPKCFGETGSIYISVSGGTGGNYSYNWSNGVIIDDNININSGTYTVTVTNSSCSATQSFTVNAAPSQLLDSITSTNTACGSNNGTATVHPYGGTASYTFLWSTTATTQTITNLPQGTYVVTVTDFNGCIKRDSVEILNDNAPVLTINNIDEPLCYGGAGSITLNASGGVLPYSFLWSNGAIDSINTNIPSGVYTCTVTGGNGCSSDITVFLNQPLPISASLQISPENCGNDDGAVTVFPSGGNGPYQYQWSSGETIQTIFNKNHGTYIVTITDFNQCTFIDTVIIPEVQGALIIADSVVNILCHGQSTGAIYVSTTGGLPPLQYQWSNSSILEDLTNVPAGNYSITIADANGCVTSFDTLLTEPSAINKTISTTPSGCGLSNGTATVTGAGGVPPYTYLWFNGSTQTTITGLSAGTYTVTVTDSNNCSVIDFALVSNTGGPVITIDSIISNKCYGDSLGAIFTTVTDGTFPYTLIWSNGKTGDDITNLFAGTYTLTVTDANNCVSIKDTIVKENTRIITSIITTPPNCGSANGTAFLFPTGGIPAYTYLWQLSGSTLPYQTNLPAGVFPVKITDAVGCILDTAAVITSPGAPQITLDSIINVTCNGGDNGAISINVTGGTQPYTYFWQNTFPAQTTQNVTNLTAGTYIVNVTDTNGCVAAIGYTVTEPTPIQISFSPFDPSCGNSNGSILSSVTGGNSGSYTYLWSTGNTFSNIANVPAGSYTLTVTDSKGCKDSAIASLNNINGPEIIVTDSSNITCNGLNNGYINTQIINGTPPFNILWTPTNQNTPNISNLSVGIYTLTVTDALNCIAVRSVEITEPDSINFNASIPVKNGIYNITCRGDNDGEITLFVSGGTPFVSSGFPVYNYFWNPSGATTQSIVGLPAGVYSVDITDSVGCVRNASFTITEPPFVTASAGPSFRICGTDTAQLSAASPTYGTGSWTVLDGSASFADSSQNNTSLSGLAYGDNLLAWIVSDGECRDTAFLVISRDSIVQAFAGTDRDVCDPGLVLTATQPQFGNGMWEVLEGTGTIVSPNLAASPVTGMNYGNNLFTWTITNGNCIDDDTVRIVYNTPDECFDELEMPTGITPNGDDINDFFFVRGLDYDNNNLLILNRWGNVVYEKENYKNDWSGTNKTGSGLPDGTYYVILKVPSRNATLKGYVDIRR